MKYFILILLTFIISCADNYPKESKEHSMYMSEPGELYTLEPVVKENKLCSSCTRPIKKFTDGLVWCYVVENPGDDSISCVIRF